MRRGRRDAAPHRETGAGSGARSGGPGGAGVGTGALDERWDVVAAALERLPIGIVVTGADGTALVANTRASAPLGDLTGDTLVDIALRRALAGARDGQTTTEEVDIAGTQPRRVEVTATPLGSSGGVAASGGGTPVVAIVVDTTERLRLDAVRRDFVANVNHELRTPIGALAVLAEALAGERDPATVDRLAGRIAAEADRARALIDDLLDFARVESADQPAHQPVDLADVIDIAVARVAAAAEQRRVTVRVDARPTTVTANREQLATAVANLLDNAVKYSDEGAAVDVSVRPAGGGDGGDAGVDLVVRDRGIGIPARDLDRIFERFYRVDHARDRRTGGTGLGLAIVRHVIANHGGEVLVDSQEGVGSSFTLRFPGGERR